MESKNRFYIIFAVFFACASYESDAQTTLQKHAEDHYEICFHKSTMDSIRILQITDLHLGNHWVKDLKVTKRVRQMVFRYKPDMLFVTGDLFTGEKDRHSYVFPFAADFLDALELPWLYVFGNHDPEGNVGREPIRALFNQTDWGIVGFHPAGAGSIKCDYKVDLKTHQLDQPAWEVYAFDSGSEPGSRSIKSDQIRWFQKKSKPRKKNETIIPAVSIFHIPLLQYQSLWYDSTITKTGFLHEKVCFEEDDGSVYDAFVKQGTIKACFCGHDHDNNYWGVYKGGILLAYGHVTGEACYHRHWPPGGKLIRLPVNGGDIAITDLTVIIE